MRIFSQQARRMLRHPGAFALRTLRGFRANQGLLLAGAVAYYALLSLVPLLILIAIALSHFIDRAVVLWRCVDCGKEASSCPGACRN